MHWPRFFRALETLKLVVTEPAHPAAIGPHPRFRDALSITPGDAPGTYFDFGVRRHSLCICRCRLLSHTLLRV